jgi:hypothetical protein
MIGAAARAWARRVGALVLTLLVVTAMPASAAVGDTVWSHNKHSDTVSDVEMNDEIVVSGSDDGLTQAEYRNGTAAWNHTRISDANGIGMGGGFVATAAENDEIDVAAAKDGSQQASISSGFGNKWNGVSIGPDGQLVAGTANADEGQLFVYDIDGNFQWEYEYQDGANNDGFRNQMYGVAVGENHVVAGGRQNILHIFDRSGTEEHAISVGGTVQDAAINDGTVVAAAGGKITAYDADTGDKLWQQSRGADAVDIDGRTVVSGGGSGDVVVADRDSGVENFRYSEGGTIRGVGVDGQLLALSDGGEVKAIENGPSFDDPDPTSGGYDDSVPLEVSVAGTNGDTYTVAWYDTTAGDETIIASKQVSSDARVSATWDIETTDSRTYRARLREDGSVVAQTQEFEINTPQTLEIRNETAPGSLVTSDVTVQFFGEDGDAAGERTTSDGTIDMSGLPRDGAVTLLVTADGFTDRTTIAKTIFEPQRIYLLDEDVSSSTIRFELNDQTGRFSPGETILRVQKPIEENGERAFQTVAGDRFDSGGSVITTLETGQRYRLEVTNDRGETRVLGSYTTSGDAAEPLPIGEIVLAGDARDAGVAAQASLQNGPPDASHSQEVRMMLIDSDRATSTFDLQIVNESGGIIRNQTTEEGPFGRFAETYPLQPSEFNGSETLYVEFNVTRNGERQQIRRPIGDVPDIATDWAINDRVLELMGFVGLVGVMGLVVIANASLAAIVGVLVAALMTLLGILDIPAVAIGVAGSVAILYRLGDQR